ncbi:hypothetical protein PR001_g11726 [Phytophthora rubi]|uniref:Integrase zinc-binding domain-containing protein n=1 Tax=Phytophthora rubi TaxID=129364 RepID=A0A6A3MEP2_9STRA|nr:hypothetical protein PR001_g11726 [Phytophthora rubi]
MNGELERARVAKWVSTLRKEDAAPLTNEASLQIGDMEPKDKDLFIDLLRQYAEIIEKKEECPPLAKVKVQHHINTGDAAPIMLRRRLHAVSENAIIDKEVDEMLRDEVIEEGEGAWGFPVVLSQPGVYIEPTELIGEVGQEGGAEDEPAIRQQRQDDVVQLDEPAQQPDGSQSSSLVVERALSSQEGSDDESVRANAVAKPVTADVKLLADAQRVVRTGKQELAQLAVQRLRVDATTTEQTLPADTAAATQCLQSGDVVAADVDREAEYVVRAVSVQRVEAAEMGVVQFTDDDIRREQQHSVMVRALKERGSYQDQWVFTDEAGLINIETEEGEARVILPAVYWALAFKEAHDSIWAGHLRGPQTFERVWQLYWWPKMHEAVQHWVSACQDCGSRKARPKAVVPPLRSVRTGAVCDRWGIDVTGPLPVTANGHCYVIAAVEYTTLLRCGSRSARAHG